MVLFHTLYNDLSLLYSLRKHYDIQDPGPKHKLKWALNISSNKKYIVDFANIIVSNAYSGHDSNECELNHILHHVLWNGYFV